MSDFYFFTDNDDADVSPFNDDIRMFCAKLKQYLAEHEADVHDGEKCDEERANIVAYLLHCVGYSDLGSLMLEVVECLAIYRRSHDARNN
jgi:hypothetical protein